MRKVIFVLILFSIFRFSFSQSIPSYWINIYDLEELYLLKSNNVEQIIAHLTGYYSSGETYKQKWVYNFISPRHVVGQVFKDGDLSSFFELEFDLSGKVVRKELSSKKPLVGWQSKVIMYEYESEKLVYEKHYNKDLQLIDYAKFEYNFEGKPIKMSIIDSSDKVISYETADYDDHEKRFKYKVYNSNGTVKYESIEFLNLDESENQYNDQGDLVLLKWPRSNPDQIVFHSLEYEYDNEGNWVKRKWIILDGKRKSKRSIVKRKILYKKTSYNKPS